MDLYTSLDLGYLPSEMPVSFSSRTFASAASSLTPIAGPLVTNPVRFSLARAGGVRRPTEIPNPLAQLRTSEVCAANWRALQRLTAKSPISLSRPVRRKAHRSLAPLHDLGRRPALAIERMPGGRVTLRTDISQFYPSIYTHAVDWAIRGKAVAKRSRRARVLGAELDARLRESRDGQTVGVSIGPDTSWLVSELVLGRIDERLTKAYPQLADRAFRVVDDMTFYASSVGEAHDVLATYQHLLADFELTLNPTKVSVTDGLEPARTPWVSTLRQLRYRHEKDDQLARDVIDLFASAFDLRKTYPTDGVLSYAIKMCDPFPAGALSWPIYRDLVLASVSQEPSTLRHVYQVLTFAKSHGLDVNNDRLVQVLNQECIEHARYDHGYEVAWILTTLRELNLPIDGATARAVAAMEDNASLVLLSEMLRSDPALLAIVDFDPAVRRAERVGALSTSDWLLAYQLRRGRWCPPRRWDGVVQWQELNRANVDFLLTRSVAGARRRISRRRPSFITTWVYP